MPETYSPSHTEVIGNTSEKKTKNRKEKLSRAMASATLAAITGGTIAGGGIALAGEMKHDDALHYFRKAAGIERVASEDSLREISSMMEQTIPGGPEMQKYESYRMVDASADLRHDVAAEYGLEAIEPRPFQGEIANAKSLDDIDRALRGFSQEAGIPVSLMRSGTLDMSQILNGSDIKLKLIQNTSSEAELLRYKSNTINALDGIASLPKETFQEMNGALERIILTASVYSDNEPFGGAYNPADKSIYVSLGKDRQNTVDEVVRHEISHAMNYELHAREIIDIENDEEFSSIKAAGSATSYEAEHASEYSLKSTEEDRAEIFRYTFNELHPSRKLQVNTAYDLRFNDVVRTKMALSLARAEMLEPGLGKFLVRTAPYSANSAVAYLPQLGK